MTADIENLEKKMTPQAKPTTVPGKIIDLAVSSFAPTALSILNTAASMSKNYNSLGETAEQVFAGSTPPTKKSTAPTKGNALNTDKTKKKKKDPVGIYYEPAQLGPKNMRVGRLARGGLVSYKSISDMERGR